jgi:hypothetical protein
MSADRVKHEMYSCHTLCRVYFPRIVQSNSVYSLIGYMHCASNFFTEVYSLVRRLAHVLFCSNYEVSITACIVKHLLLRERCKFSCIAFPNKIFETVSG